MSTRWAWPALCAVLVMGCDDCGQKQETGGPGETGEPVDTGEPAPEEFLLDGADAILDGRGDLDVVFGARSSADITGDGAPDVVVYGAVDNMDGTESPELFLLSGTLTGTVRLREQAVVHYEDAFASEVTDYVMIACPAGDLGGDGHEDLAVVYGDSGGTSEVWIYDGPITASSRFTTEPDSVLNGVATATKYREMISSAGDFNGDGIGDLLVGSPNADDRAGGVFVVYGPISDIRSVEDADLRVVNDEGGKYLGSSVSGLGDQNRDGYGDIVVGSSVGARSYDSHAYLLSGGNLGDVSISEAQATIRSAKDYDFLGNSVSSVGDVDLDGLADILVGASCYNLDDDPYGVYTSGAAFLLHGPLTGAVDAADADVSFHGLHSMSHLGWSVTGAGDTNGDGQVEVLVGAPHFYHPYDDAGQAFLFRDPNSRSTFTTNQADILFQGTEELDGTGVLVDGGVDLNADGLDDLLITAAPDLDGLDRGAPGLGVAYLVYGRAEEE